MRSLFIAGLFAATFAAAPSLAATRGFPVGGFDRIRSTVPFDVRVHTGAAPGVRAQGPQEALDKLAVSVRGGELVIGTVRGNWMSSWHWTRGERVTIDVTVPMISGAALSGPGDLTIDQVRARSFDASLSGPGNLTIGQLDAGHAELRLAGPGDLTISGRAGSANVMLAGPGDVRAGKLTVQDISVQLSGPGDIVANATRSATGHVSGPGDVRIGGHPRCTITKSGPGDVICG